MDRRDALRKLGAGGAIAVGGATIVSQPAFAFTSPQLQPPPNDRLIISFSGITASTVDVSLALPAPLGCPASATGSSYQFIPGISGQSPSAEIEWEYQITPVVGPNADVGVHTTGSGQNSASFVVSLQPGLQWINGYGLLFATIGRYCCEYTGATRCCDFIWRDLYQVNGNGAGASFSFFPSTNQGPTLAQCFTTPASP